MNCTFSFKIVREKQNKTKNIEGNLWNNKKGNFFHHSFELLKQNIVK